MKEESLLQKIFKAIKLSEQEGLVQDSCSEILTGFSGKKLVGALQRITTLLTDEKTCYLEVGVFQGLTLLSVATSCPGSPCYGIDNFAFFDPESKNLGIIKDRIEKLDLSNAYLINRDYEDALEHLVSHIGNKKVGVYFIDGPHDYRSQLMCLELVLPYLHENAVILIDDCNYRHVRQANRDFLITHPDFKLLFESYGKCHPCNMTMLEEKEARDGWWDGINIIVKDNGQELKPMYPPTERSRLLYENEHIIHASKIAELAPQAIDIVQAGYEMKFRKMIGRIIHFYKASQTVKFDFRQRYSATNTYSESLPKSNYNFSAHDLL